MKKLDIITETYEFNSEWNIDIVEKPDEFESYLYRKNCGMKTFIVGVPKDQPNGDIATKETFIEDTLFDIETIIDIYDHDIQVLEDAFQKEFFDKE